MLSANAARGKVLLKRTTGGALFAKSTMFAPTLGLTKSLVPAAPTAIPTGRTFNYRLSWRCAGSVSPQDDCFGMQITDQLPAYIEYVPSASFTTPVVSVTPSGTAAANGSTRQTITVAFAAVVTAGSTGELDIPVRYIPGTTPDAIASENTAVISSNTNTGSPVPPVTSNPVPTTSVATDKASVEKTFVYGGAAGDLTAYDIKVCNDPGSSPEGYLAFTNFSVSDTLPAGAQFVSANPAPASSAGPIVWNFPTGLSGGCTTIRLVVRYPVPPFAVGQMPNNQATVTGTLAGGTTKTLNASRQITLAGPGPGSSIGKTAASTDKGSPDQRVGGDVSFNISASNSGNVTQSMVVTDPIPNETNLHTINAGGADLVEYQANGNPAWIVASSAAPIAQVLVSSLGLGAGYVSGVRLTYNNVPPGDSGGRSFELVATIINPPHGGAAYTLPRTFNNTATVDTIYNGVSAGTNNATAPFTIVDNTATIYPQATKSILSGNSLVPGDTIRFRVAANNVRATNGTAFTNPVLTDLLADNLEYVADSAAITQNGTTGCATPAGNPQIVPNYSGTQTLLVWNWTGTGCSIPEGANVAVVFEARVKVASAPGSFSNESAITDLTPPAAPFREEKRYCGNGNDPYPTGAIGSTGASVDAADLCRSDEVGYVVVTSAQADSRKGVNGQLKADGNPLNDAWNYSMTTNVASTIRGGGMMWSMEINNPGNVPFTSIDVIDILPFNLPAPGNVGAGTNAPMGSTWQPRFVAPIFLGAAPPGTKVYYSTTANPCRPTLDITSGCTTMTTLADGVPQTADGQWSTVFPSDPTTIRSFRLVFGAYVLAPGTTLRFEWPMSAPNDAPFATNGDDGLPATIDDTNIAWNTFAYSAVRTDTMGRLSSAPTRVGIEVRGLPIELASYGDYVWLDTNRDGLQNELPANGLNGVRVELCRDDDGDSDVTTGVQTVVAVQLTANDATGNPGYYLFPGLETGKYYAKFTAPNEFMFASPANANGNLNDTTDSDGVAANNTQGLPVYRSHVTMIMASAPNSGTPGQAYRDTDQGFYNLTVAIGNTVWFDTNNDGVIQPTEAGKDGLLVELFRDANASGALEDLTGIGGINEWLPISRQLTTSGGYYLFTQRTDAAGLGTGLQLIPGQFIVGISPYNFLAAGAPATIGGAPFMAGMLAGYKSSGTTISGAGALAESPIAPNGTTDSNADNADDGTKQSTGFYNNGVMSTLLVIDGRSIEPTNETTQPAGTTGGNTLGHPNTVNGIAGGGVAILDADSNVTVDFGFYTQYLGNLVFADTGAGANYNNGQRDLGELGIGGVPIQIFNATGVIEIPVGPDGIYCTADDAPGGITTSSVPATLGQYQFCGLPQGQYVVKITSPAGSFSSNDRVTTPTPEGNTDSDDNGIGTATGMIFSVTGAPALTLTPGNELVVTNANGTTTNPTLDFGLMLPPVSIGNTVWFDTNNDGTIQPTEIGINGVKVELFLDANGNGVLNTDAEQTPIATQTTANGGYYLFTQTTSAAGVGTGAPLTAGKYFVGIAAMNFTAGMPLAGYHSSVTSINGTGVISDATVATNTDLNGDNLDDGVKQTTAFYAGGVLSGQLMVMVGGEPAGETTLPANVSGGATPGRINTIDGTNATTAINDADSNVTVDFGFYTTKLGDIVFSDDGGGVSANYDNALRSTGELGLPGLVVKLFAADGTTEINVGPDGRLGTADDAAGGVTTGSGANAGRYEFCNLPAGQYRVQVAVPLGYRSSTDIGSTTAPDGNVNEDDNGVTAGTGPTVISNAITLSPGSVGATNANTVTNATGLTLNPSLDFGMTPRGLAIGNTVWLDTNNSGTIDAMEKGKDGVRVELFLDADGVGGLTGAEQAPIAVQLTTAGGYYLFTQATNAAGLGTGSPLLPGKYFIGIAPSNFAGTGMLVGLHSSGTVISNVGALSDTAIAGNQLTDNDRDNFDDGAKQTATPFYAGGVLSQQLMLSPSTEPSDETTLGMPGATGGTTPGHPQTLDGTANGATILDNNANLTVDFGFYTQKLGDIVFGDVSTTANTNNGLLNSGETGVAGAVLKLFAADGVTEIPVGPDGLLGTADDATGATNQLTTTATGAYQFCNLPQGSYVVKMTAPAGYVSSKDPATGGAPDNNTNSDDNGTGTNPMAVSAPMALQPGAAGAANNNTVDTLTGTTNHPTLDFGVLRTYSLGNRVWKDLDNNGTINAADTAAPGVNGVTLRLINALTNAQATDVTGALVADQVTAGGGYYRFDNLVTGDYFVEVAASNFGGVLNGCTTSTGASGVAPSAAGPYEMAPDADTTIVDGDDNGTAVTAAANVAVRSKAVTLGDGNGAAEPTTDNDPATNPQAGEAPNNQSDRTVDFGFAPLMNLGNLVWKDYDNDGIRDTANPNEPVVSGVKLVLYGDTNNNGTFELATDAMFTMQNTTGAGAYSFTNLLPGNYFVVADASNFTGAGALVGCLSSTYNVTGNSNTDNNDHGVDNPTPATGGVATSQITLVGGTEPTDDGNDGNGNQTIDFGFIPTNLVIGNLIWKDTDFNGTKGATENGIGGVKVNLYRDVNRNGTYEAATDSLVIMTTTNGSGGYAFTGLIPDPYFVQVDSSNFEVGAPLYGCASSFTTQTGNSDVNEQDHGSDNSDPRLYPPITSVITMIAFNEPHGSDGDDTNGNLTIDFGFVNIQVTAVDDMGMCLGPGATLAYTFKVTNPGATKQNDNPGPEFSASFPTGLVGVPGSGVSSGGGTITVTATGVTWDGMIPAGAMVTLSYRAQVGNSVAAGTDLVVSSTVYADGDNNGSNEGQTTTTQSKKVNCAPVGPGIIPEGGSGSSVLIFPIYTSNASNPASQNTRINLTNFHASKGVNLHLFLVDGENCSVADANLCLTANQTATMLMSDLDPGTTGYLMAVAVDSLGCPINFNFLGGDAYTKFDSGHRGNLTAQGVSALAGGLPACDANSSNATLKFDGVSYGMLPRTVALSSIGSRADGNHPLLVLDRIGGDLSSSADRLGPIFGLVYDDAEKAYSFSFTPNTCQFRSELGGSFPRTTPRLDALIGAGRTGWMKFYASPDAALIGGAFNFNDNAASQPGAFNGGHGLHTLTTTNTASVTIPVFPPTC